MKAIWKIAFVFLLTVGGMFAVSLNTLAAAKPYEYTFTKDTNNTKFNQVASINQLEITFDKTISVVKDRDGDTNKDQDDLFIDKASDNPIYILQKSGKDRINIIKDVTFSGNKLNVTFKNLDYIDYTDPEKLEYELVIDKETLQFDQLEEYRIPFNIYDILPGFKSTFIDTDASIINNNIFKINAPRDVLVHVPKIFIRGIETIHHNDGMVPKSSPALTNIDILADEEATRLKVEFDGNPEHSRDLARHPDVKGFTMGQAGIKEVTDDQLAKEFSLKAYNDNGRFLEERRFKLKVDHQKNDYKINNYLPEPTKEFGQPYTLYELMEDPKLLNTIIERIPVSQLDSLGITYKTQNSFVEVKSLEELQMALANSKVTTIKLPSSLTLTDDLVVNRTVTIEGPSNVTGNILLQGTDITARLNNITINGDLTVDVGVNGTAILDTSSAANTTIVSGGVNSVHFKDFKTEKLDINNTSELRVVVDGGLKTSTATDATDTPVTIGGSSPVTLEGVYGDVTVNSSITLNINEKTKIASLEIEEDKTLTIAGTGGNVTSITGDGEVDFAEKEYVNLFEWTYKGETTGLSADSGSNITLNSANIEGNDIALLPLGQNVNWKLKSWNNIGTEAQVYWDSSTTILKVSGASIPAGETGEIILEYIEYKIENEVKTKTVYEVTIPVTVETETES